MRRAMVVAAVLVACSNEAPRPGRKSTPEELEASRLANAAAAKAAEDARPKPPPPPQKSPTELLAEHLQSGTITDDDVVIMGVEADRNKAITYAHLKKNADRYRGKVWRFRGKILEIGEADGHTKARIGLDSYGQEVMFVEAPFETEFVDGNKVEVLGVLMGSFSYTSQAGWNIAIPSMIAARITKPKAPKPITMPGLQMLKE